MRGNKWPEWPVSVPSGSASLCRRAVRWGRPVVFIRNNMAFLYYKLNFVSFCWISGAIVLSLLP